MYKRDEKFTRFYKNVYCQPLTFYNLSLFTLTFQWRNSNFTIIFISVLEE